MELISAPQIQLTNQNNFYLIVNHEWQMTNFVRRFK